MEMAQKAAYEDIHICDIKNIVSTRWQN